MCKGLPANFAQSGGCVTKKYTHTHVHTPTCMQQQKRKQKQIKRKT